MTTNSITVASNIVLNIQPNTMYFATEDSFWTYLDQYHMNVHIGSDTLIFADTNTMFKGPIHLSRNDIQERRRHALGEPKVCIPEQKTDGNVVQ